jgi:DNA-binding IclR family transcriptional regulator
MTRDAATVRSELGKAASLRIVDLMDRTGMPRARVRAALDALRASGQVQAFAMGSRYSVRRRTEVA